jgi:poly-beta-1,6-N-acetyl-D-glucosamine synthase
MKWGLPIGLNVLFWGLIGIIRFVNEKINRRKKGIVVFEDPLTYKKKRNTVAICIAAKNEEKVIGSTINSVKKLVPTKNIYLISDGSTDTTADIARSQKINVLEAVNSHGKGLALEMLINKFYLLDRYKYILFVDADTRINKDYIHNALAFFEEDSRVACIAGYAKNQWRKHKKVSWKYGIVGYRARLYSMMQLLMVYGQTWRHLNVTNIVPGFASMYRTEVLKKLKIHVPGLIIEDFNLAFQIRKKRLGIIAHHPSVYGIAQDPTTLGDYIRQVQRWNLGFFQTVKKYKIWASLFWLSLSIFIIEGFISAVFFLSVPIILLSLAFIVFQLATNIWLVDLNFAIVSLILDLSEIIIGIIIADYLLTVFIALKDRRPMLLLYGVTFVFFRYIDAFILLTTTPKAFFVKSQGIWTSPKRT